MAVTKQLRSDHRVIWREEGRCSATPTDNAGSAAIQVRFFHPLGRYGLLFHSTAAVAGVISPLVGKHFANAHDLLRRLFLLSRSSWPFSSLALPRRRTRKCARMLKCTHLVKHLVRSRSHPRSLVPTLLHPIEANLKQTRARQRPLHCNSLRSLNFSQSLARSASVSPRLISLSQSRLLGPLPKTSESKRARTSKMHEKLQTSKYSIFVYYSKSDWRNNDIDFATMILFFLALKFVVNNVNKNCHSNN